MSTSPITPGENILPEFGVFTPPSPLPNPADLSAGKYGNNLRYGILNLEDPEVEIKFKLVLTWLAAFGAPVANYVYFTPTEGGISSTQIIFLDATGKRSVHDATMLFNQPEVALQQMLLAFDLPARAGYQVFPGFAAVNEQNTDPVGNPMPGRDTPGWGRPFARYYSTSSVFSESKYAVGDRFLRIQADEEYQLTRLIFGRRPGPTPFSSILDIRFAWERLR